MKRLMIFVLMGCGATQGDDPEIVPRDSVETAPIKDVAEVVDTKVPKKLKAPAERRLYPQKFSATSHLENDWNKFQENYLADYLGDDNPKTSWTEGKEDVGLGERVFIEHTPLEDASKIRLEIRNGYQKTSRLFKRNARAKDITIKLFPGGTTSKHTLTDSEGWQSLSVEQPTGPLNGYEIQFDSVYYGTHYQDLVVSDIQTYVTALTPDNPGYETSKQKRLLDWVAERKLAAQQFRDAAKGSMPVATGYAKTILKESERECYDMSNCSLPFELASKQWGNGKPLFGALEAAAQEKFRGWKQVRISAADERRIPQVDSFRFPRSWWSSDLIYQGDATAIIMPIPRLIAYFNAKNLKRVYVETKAVKPERAVQGKAPGCKNEATYFYTPEGEGPLRTLLIAQCGQYEERDGFVMGMYWQVLNYGDDGQLAQLFDFYSASTFTWTKKDGAPFLESVTRVSNGGAPDTRFTAK